MFGAEHFFHVDIDDNSLDVEAEQRPEALPRTTPLQELRRYFDSEMANASGARKQELQDAFETASALLQEAGAW